MEKFGSSGIWFAAVCPQDAGQEVRWLRIKYLKQGGTRLTECAVRLQSIPSTEVGVTLIWVLLQLLIFSVGAVAFWSRPFDEAARRFFAMCIVTLGAFVGGFHWSIIAGNFWLTLPFAVSGILLPAVILHFFLVYPRVKPPLAAWPRAVLWRVYSIPAAAILCFVLVDGLVWMLSVATYQVTGVSTQLMMTWLNYLRYGIYVYLSISGCYFAVTIFSLIHSVFTTRNPVELSQVRWILWAGAGAGGCIGYALVLAVVDRTDFAVHWGSQNIRDVSCQPGVHAGLRDRHHPVQADADRSDHQQGDVVLCFQLWCMTGVLALVISIGSQAVAVGKLPAVEQLGWILGGISTLGVILMLWVRDSWQHFVDRRFFREKYQLDKALQRMHREVGRLTDVQFLSERMSISCRDVLQSSRIGLYLSDGKPNGFRLTAGCR